MKMNIAMRGAWSLRILMLLTTGALTVGSFTACTAATRHTEAKHEASSRRDAALRDGTVERKLVRSGAMTVAVSDPEAGGRAVEAMLDARGGYVERSSHDDERGIRLTCRVPESALDRFMDDVGAIGDELTRSTSAEDVTDAYHDLQVRLDNNIALRDRLRQLLEQAAGVEELLAVETQLSRIQTEVEVLQSRLDRLTERVEMSTLRIELEPERILGPLGYIGHGLWWAFSKLFVIS